MGPFFLVLLFSWKNGGAVFDVLIFHLANCTASSFSTEGPRTFEWPLSIQTKNAIHSGLRFDCAVMDFDMGYVRAATMGNGNIHPDMLR